MILVKKIVCTLVFGMAAIALFGQKQSSDFGVFLGGSTPWGDYTQTDRLQSVKLNFGGFYRYNFNNRFAFRANGQFGTVGAQGHLEMLPVEFRKTVVDLSALIEFNYFEFVLGSDDHRLSPYVFTGVSALMFAGASDSQVLAPAIPLGIGGKLSLNKRWGVSIEGSLRKTFSDELDHLDNPYTTYNNLMKVSDNWHNNDWLGYLGVTVFYRFIHNKSDCPAYESAY